MGQIFRLVAGSGNEPTASSNQYFLKINRFHGDPRKPHFHSPYPTCAAAIAATKEMIDGLLKAGHKPHMTADYLYNKWLRFGDDPTVIGPYPKRVFDACEYAERRCYQIIEFHEKDGQIWEQFPLPLSF